MTGDICQGCGGDGGDIWLAHEPKKCHSCLKIPREAEKRSNIWEKYLHLSDGGGMFMWQANNSRPPGRRSPHGRLWGKGLDWQTQEQSVRREEIKWDVKDRRRIDAGTVLLDLIQCSITFTAVLIHTGPNTDSLIWTKWVWLTSSWLERSCDLNTVMPWSSAGGRALYMQRGGK